MRYFYGYLLTASVILMIGAVGVYKSTSIGVAQDAPALVEESSNAGRIEGNVLEILDVPGYTYVQVDAAGDEVWAAAPSVPVEVGDTVSFATNMPMRNFYSNTLQREFEVIYFVDRFSSDTGISSIDSEAAAAHGQMFEQEAVAPVRDIPKAEDGYTVAEIMAKSNELGGESVRVRGQVVKVTSNVMGTNWVRIMDSSSNQHLVVPTPSKAAVNDIVFVEGTLRINLDLGQGYTLPAVLQEAAVTIE